MTTPRTKIFDTAKGIGIFLTVIATTLHTLLTSPGYSITSGGAETAYYLISLFLAPLFFFIAGFFVSKSLNEGSKPFIRKKLANFLSLYFLFSYLQAILQMYLFNKIGEPIYWTRALSIPFYPYKQFWFLHALLIHYFIIAIIPRLTVGYIAGALAGYWLSMKLTGYPEMVSYHFIFFASGAAISSGFLPQELEVNIKKYKYFAFGICAVFFYIAASVNFAFEQFDPQTRLSVLAGFAGTGLILTISALHQKIGSIFSYFGRLAFPIYLLHSIAISSVILICKQLNLHDFEEHFIIGVIAGVALPISLYEAYETVSENFFEKRRMIESA